VSLVAEQAAFLLDVAKLINKATELGFVVTGGELARTPEQQPALTPVGEYWQSLNPKNQWGGFWKSFKDVPHFERKV